MASAIRKAEGGRAANCGQTLRRQRICLSSVRFGRLPQAVRMPEQLYTQSHRCRCQLTLFISTPAHASNGEEAASGPVSWLFAIATARIARRLPASSDAARRHEVDRADAAGAIARAMLPGLRVDVGWKSWRPRRGCRRASLSHLAAALSSRHRSWEASAAFQGRLSQTPKPTPARARGDSLGLRRDRLARHLGSRPPRTCRWRRSCDLLTTARPLVKPVKTWTPAQPPRACRFGASARSTSPTAARGTRCLRLWFRVRSAPSSRGHGRAGHIVLAGAVPVSGGREPDPQADQAGS